MNDYELAISTSKKLEGFLEREYGASGRGLHDKLTSVAVKIDDSTARDLRYIASVRNRLIHDDSTHEMDDREGFLQAAARVYARFNIPPISSNSAEDRMERLIQREHERQAVLDAVEKRRDPLGLSTAEKRRLTTILSAAFIAVVVGIVIWNRSMFIPDAISPAPWPEPPPDAPRKPLGAVAVPGEGFLASPYGGKEAVGMDDRDVWGGLTGAELGEFKPGRPGKATPKKSNGTRVEEGTLKAHGSVRADVIRRVARAHVSEVQACYEAGLGNSPKLDGHMSVAFEISTSGRVGSVSVQDTDITDPSIAACIVTALGRWAFPKSRDGKATTVEYTIKLKASD